MLYTFRRICAQVVLYTSSSFTTILPPIAAKKKTRQANYISDKPQAAACENQQKQFLVRHLSLSLTVVMHHKTECLLFCLIKRRTHSCGISMSTNRVGHKYTFHQLKPHSNGAAGTALVGKVASRPRVSWYGKRSRTAFSL